MTTDLQINGNTVEAGDTLLRLDALAQGYEEVLEQARTQLERFEFSPQDWDRLCNRLQENVRYTRIADEIYNLFIYGCRAIENGCEWNSQMEAADYLINAIASKVARRLIETDFQQLIKEEVSKATVGFGADIDDRVKHAVDIHVSRMEKNTIADASAQRYHLKEMVNKVFGDDFKQMAKQAAADLQSQQQGENRDS